MHMNRYTVNLLPSKERHALRENASHDIRLRWLES
jgi:hypothetical protein